MIAAIYARKSTEQRGADDEAKSVARQIDNARAFAAERGWAVEHVFCDDAVSGAETRKLKDRQRLLDLIESGRAPFQVLIMRDQSRFSRRDGDEAFGQLKAITRSGIEIWFYQDRNRFAFGTMGDNIVGFVRAEAAADYRRQIAQWTYEAMKRKAQAGHVTGGRTFGYDNVRVNGHVERQINDPEAAVVRSIFERYAAGQGLVTIAKQLNAERAPCPRPQQKRPAGWSPSSVREVLYRDLYNGVIVWNKTKKRNDDGEQQSHPKDRSHWLRVDAPQLRIVPAELWQEVQTRLETVRTYALRLQGGRLAAGPPPVDVNVGGKPAKGHVVPYLLSGFMRCPCGAGFEAVSRPSAGRRIFAYRCSANKRKGSIVCPNDRLILMEEADEAVLNAVEYAIFSSGVVEAVTEGLLAELGAEQTVDRMAAVERELVEVKTALSNLIKVATAAAAAGHNLVTLTTEMGQCEQRQRALEIELATLAGQRKAFDPVKTRAWIERRLADWRKLLRNNREQGRQVLQHVLVGDPDRRLVFTPTEEGGYTFNGTGTLGKILSGICGNRVASPTGFEPVFQP